MNRLALSLLLALSTTAPFTGANAGTGKATTLMAKELPDFPGKEGMVEVVDYAPGEFVAHRPVCEFVRLVASRVVQTVEFGALRIDESTPAFVA